MKKFEEDMERLADSVTEMGELASDMLRGSSLALKNTDAVIATMVIEKYERIKYLDSLIEEECLRILILYQPMAADMRYVATVLKIITYLERIGKYSKNISKVVKNLDELPMMEDMNDIQEMSRVAEKMVYRAVDSFVNKNISALDDYSELDDQLDSLKKKVINDSINHMINNPKDVATYTYCISVARFLERVGDHACKTAEKAIYMVSGKLVELDVPHLK